MSSKKKMNSKKVIALIVIGLFAFGSFGMMSFGGSKDNSSNGDSTNLNSNQQEETQAEMMERMHPSQDKTAPVDDLNKDIAQLTFADLLGETAPDFTLTSQDGETFTLSDYKDKTVILFFSGGAMCYPACWDEIESLSTDERFNNEDVRVVSIVVDEKEKWDKIISAQPKYGAGTILLDTNKVVSEAYDMLSAPSSMHKGKFPGHTYLIVKDGIISDMVDDPRMASNTDLVASKL